MLIKIIIGQIIIMLVLINIGTSLRFWEKKGWIHSIDFYGWFQ